MSATSRMKHAPPHFKTWCNFSIGAGTTTGEHHASRRPADRSIWDTGNGKGWSRRFDDCNPASTELAVAGIAQ